MRDVAPTASQILENIDERLLEIRQEEAALENARGILLDSPSQQRHVRRVRRASVRSGASTSGASWLATRLLTDVDADWLAGDPGGDGPPPGPKGR